MNSNNSTSFFSALKIDLVSYPVRAEGLGKYDNSTNFDYIIFYSK